MIQNRDSSASIQFLTLLWEFAVDTELTRKEQPSIECIMSDGRRQMTLLLARNFSVMEVEDSVKIYLCVARTNRAGLIAITMFLS